MKAYNELLAKVREASLLESTASLLGWDQETMMPEMAVEHRSAQLSQLARMVHQLQTDPRIGELLSACESDGQLMADPHGDTATNVREIRRSYKRATLLPAKLVEELASLSSIAHHQWTEARRLSDYSRFQPHLEKMLHLIRQQAECYGWEKEGEPWDALAEDYDPGCTAKQMEAVFTPMRTRLTELLRKLVHSSRQPSDQKLKSLRVPIERQQQICRWLVEQIGFDFRRGRLDVAAHPFCGGSHINDVRMTSRYREDAIMDGISSCMHESGHAMYQQGLPVQHAGTPLGDPVSLSIHESQSRLWENQVGRSQPFVRWFYPHLRRELGTLLEDLSEEELYGALNFVRPSTIRVEADEVTYNLHIMIRFELERALLRGDLRTQDLPEAWNQRYREYLGIEVPNDSEGCLQDVHWSKGAMGYFPTYTLGNLYAAQFFEKAQEALGNLDDLVRRGEFQSLRKWLNTHIHAQGKRYLSAQLCEHVTGKPLSAEPLMRHFESKLLPLYGL